MIYIYTEIRTGFHQNPLPSGNVLTSKASFADFLMMLNAALIKDTMERDMINEISALFVMIFTAGLMFVMPMLDIECDDITIIIGSGIILSFILTIIPILLSYDIRDEIIELIEDLDNQIVVDTSVYKTNLP